MGKGKLLLIFVVTFAICAAAIAYLAYDNYSLKNAKTALENEISKLTVDFIATTKKMASEAVRLNDEINSLKGELATTILQRDDFEQQYNREKSRMDDFSSQIGEVTGKVGTLEKLSQTDPELLKKYSKVYFLNENYVPKTFSKIDPVYTYDSKEDYLFNAEVWSFLRGLMETAKADDVDIKIISAYRSFGSQSSLKSSYKVTYGSGANKFSADQGYSEHQLGVTVDFTTSKIGSAFTGFEKTEAYQWLKDNAYVYGFVLSYPENNAYYQFEPWHWRFVGRSLAQKLHEDGKYFYDLSQREIDQYLISFFD